MNLWLTINAERALEGGGIKRERYLSLLSLMVLGM